MFTVVEYFVLHVGALQAVRRASLVGSLTTPKQKPKDIDLLVWIDDAVDLTASPSWGATR